MQYSSPDQSSVDIALIIALREEFDEFTATLPCDLHPRQDLEFGGYDYRFAYRGYECVVRVLGAMGPDKAGRFTDRLLSRWDSRVVVNVGIAAAMHHDLRACDVFVADQVDAYAATLKAVHGASNEEWQFEHRGRVYSTDHALAQEITNFPYAHQSAYAMWQQEGARDLVDSLLVKQGSLLRRKGLIGTVPALRIGHLASGPIVGAARAFGEWLRSRDATLHALEMEAAGLVAAATERRKPIPTLIIRGISDFGDERKPELDAVGGGALRRLAMRNATRLFAHLLTEQRLPRTEGPLIRTGLLLRTVDGDVVRTTALYRGVPVDVGRDPLCGLVLRTSDRRAARRRHVVVIAHGDRDSVEVQVFSKNGVLVAGTRYAAGAVLRLLPGQSFICGETEVAVLPEPALASTMTDRDAGGESPDQR